MAIVLPKSIQPTATPALQKTMNPVLVSPNNPVPITTDDKGQQYVNFYPSKTYFEKEQAPLKYPMASLDRLAQSDALARMKNLYPPGVEKYTLAQSLVENRPHDYGVNQVNINWGSAPTKKFLNTQKEIAALDVEIKKINYSNINAPGNFEKLRHLTQQQTDLINQTYGEQHWNKPNANYEKINQIVDQLGLNRSTNQEIEPIKNKKGNIVGYQKYDVFNGPSNPNPEQVSKYRVLALANKYYESGQKAKGLDLIQLYNGDGPKAKEYRKKVEEADYLLNKNPANQEARMIYDKLLKKYLDQYQREKQHGGS